MFNYAISVLNEKIGDCVFEQSIKKNIYKVSGENEYTKNNIAELKQAIKILEESEEE